MTITEFILARLDEDEEEIGAEIFGYDDSAGPNGIGWAGVGAISDVLLCSHRRAVAEFKAMRRIVYRSTVPVPRYGTPETEWDRVPTESGALVLGELASIWSDHPDYDQEWVL